MGLEATYKKGVKQGNKKGFVDIFKYMCKFEDVIREFMKVTFKNVQYLDGYFIFGTGINVIHFNLEETPNWKYGVWWNMPKKYYDKETKKYVLPEYIEGHFFAKYEENIIKFEPRTSTIKCDFTIAPNEEQSHLYSVIRNIDFIIKEPYLAFCRDYCLKDYNLEYLSRNKAKKIYKEWQKERRNKNV